MPAEDVLRIANCSGFYGDRLAAAREMVEGGPIDVLTGDWLAELTMLVLAKNLLRDNGAGYARTFVTQMEQVMGPCLDRGIKVVSNAGGLTSDRVTDAARAVGPAAWRHGWQRHDWDALAGAVVAGHVIECGAQATGGNFAFFTEVPGLEHPGFPIAEVAADGSSVITKHPGHGGMVSVDTVTAQLLYEIGGPAYLNPDVTARFDSIALSEDGPDRVRVSGVVGEPPPPRSRSASTSSAATRWRSR